MARRATHGQDWRAQQSSSAPQNHAGAPNGLEAATELLGFRASLCGQPYPIEGAEAAAPEWRAQHERGHSTDNARISMLAARERAERGRLREAAGELHAPRSEETGAHRGGSCTACDAQLADQGKTGRVRLGRGG